ncbi:hypothetical protein [Streptomyces sp. NPDC092129]|uniref:hypothetical protein n=1 Tax=Streptomyces sp. NPDC092129 TaxID=3366010 RepID=UPI0038050246
MLAPLALTACASHGGKPADTPTTRPSTAPPPSTAADPTAVAAPQQTPQADTPSPRSTDDDAFAAAGREADEQRAAAAADGDPVAPKDTHIPAPDEYGFKKPAATAQHGEVVAYTPRRESGRLIIPLTIHNASDDRVNYRVTITAIAASQDSPVTVTTRADNVFPHTTWPTQVDITAPSTDTSPTRIQISLHVIQDAYPFGDVH